MFRRTWIARMVVVAAATGVAIAMSAGSANAGLLPVSVTVQPESGNFRWTYSVVLPSDMKLQSGSFFQQRYDKQESGFGRYARITRFVGAVLRDEAPERPIPVALTCGTAEENLVNNRALCSALDRQGYATWLARVRDAHNWTCWRDSFDPHLPALLEAVDT